MSAVVRAQRFWTVLRKNNNRFFSVTVDPPKEPIVAASSLLNNQVEPPPTRPPMPPVSAGSEKKSWSFLKYGLIASLTGGIATAGYATYAYSLDEIEEKAKPIRASANHAIQDDGSSFGNFKSMMHSAALTVPVKLLDLYIDLRRSTEEQVRRFTEPSSDKLLPDLHPMEQHVFTLVLDLNETLVYSDWTSVDPIVDRLDPKHCIRYRLSRSATKYQNQKHYRDLSMLNRDPSRILYISGNALETSLQKENCVPIKPWKGEVEDTTLVDLIPFLEYVAVHRPADIRPVLASYQGRDIPKEFIERSKEYQKRMQEQKQKGRLRRH